MQKATKSSITSRVGYYVTENFNRKLWNAKSGCKTRNVINFYLNSEMTDNTDNGLI